MRCLPPLLSAWLLATALLLTAPPAQAQDDDPAYNAAVHLLTQTMRPYRDGRHNPLLIALRHRRDSSLAPLFDHLSASPHMPQRIHGQLGRAEISPAGHLDLAAVAEIEDTGETVALLGAALDTDLVTPADLMQVLAWDGIPTSSRLALAVHVVADSGVIDPALLRSALIDEDEPTTPQMLQHGLAALLLMQRGEDIALSQLDKLATHGPAETRDAVQAQVLEVAMRHQFEAIRPWALARAQADGIDTRLRLLALRLALRFQTPATGQTAQTQWQRLFTQTDDAAQRIRLAYIALEAAPYATPDLFRPLLDEPDELLNRIGAVGVAIAGNDGQVRTAVLDLIAHGHPMSLLWAIRYAQDDAGEAGDDYLAAVILAFDQGPDRSRMRRTDSAINAAQALAQSNPQRVLDLLNPTLQTPAEPVRRGELTVSHILLLGLVRANDSDLSDIARELPEFENADAQDLALMLRSRWGAPLTATHWDRIAQVVAGQTSLDDSLRIQLAWAHLEHTGQTQRALRDAIEQTR